MLSRWISWAAMAVEGNSSSSSSSPSRSRSSKNDKWDVVQDRRLLPKSMTITTIRRIRAGSSLFTMIFLPTASSFIFSFSFSPRFFLFCSFLSRSSLLVLFPLRLPLFSLRRFLPSLSPFLFILIQSHPKKYSRYSSTEPRDSTSMDNYMYEVCEQKSECKHAEVVSTQIVLCVSHRQYHKIASLNTEIISNIMYQLSAPTCLQTFYSRPSYNK